MAGYDSGRVKVLETSIVLAGVAILAGLSTDSRTLIWTGFALLVLAAFVTPVAAVLVNGWLWIAEKMAYVTNAVILTILFYLVLTPVALIYRLFHKDPLKLADKTPDTFYSERDHVYSKADLEKQW
jgi:hypothetical protein